MAERDTQLDSISVIEAAEDICRESAEIRAFNKRFNGNWGKDAQDLGQKLSNLGRLLSLRKYLLEAGAEDTDYFIQAGESIKVLKGDLKEYK